MEKINSSKFIKQNNRKEANCFIDPIREANFLRKNGENISKEKLMLAKNNITKFIESLCSSEDINPKEQAEIDLREKYKQFLTNNQRNIRLQKKGALHVDIRLLMSIIKQNNNNLFSLQKISEIYNNNSQKPPISKSTIYRRMKRNLGLCYKKTTFINRKRFTDRDQLIAKVFFIKLGEEIERHSMFIFFDESSFGERKLSIKVWCNADENQQKINCGRVQSVSVLGAIGKFELLKLQMLEERVTSDTVIDFFKALEEQLNNHIVYRKAIGEGRVTLILDNAKYHKSRKSIMFFKESSFRVLFLPPYSPQFNSIELIWGYLKRIQAKLILSTKYVYYLFINFRKEIKDFISKSIIKLNKDNFRNIMKKVFLVIDNNIKMMIDKE